jgi:hypothetical protein
LSFACALSRMATGWLVIKRPDTESEYHDIPSAKIAGVVERFVAIGDDPEKFSAFLSRVA